MTHRIRKLDTPEQCSQEVVRVYRKAWKREVSWSDAQGAAAVIQRLWTMLGGSTGSGAAKEEVKWENVGKNALHR